MPGRVFLIILFFLLALPARGQDFTLDAPAVVLTGRPFRVEIAREGSRFTQASLDSFQVQVGQQSFLPRLDEEGTFFIEEIQVETSGRLDITVLRNNISIIGKTSQAIPAWTSILPPIIAILVALLFKRVIPALFLGIWVGAWMSNGMSLYGLWEGLLSSFQVYVLDALANPDHAAIILFSLMIGGMVGIITKNGGTQGVVKHLTKWARSPKRGQIATGLLGLAIFFDDYANTLVVGNTMRPVTDRLRISREKLAYIVDSTAAPVSCLAFVTTWIGYEVGLIGTAVASIPGYDESAYYIFLNSIPYSFYPIFAVFFVFCVAWTRRDFGAMAAAEVRARTTGQVLRPGSKVDAAVTTASELIPKSGKPQRVINAVLPVVVLIVAVLVGLFVTGEGSTLREIIGSADSYKALMWASLLGVLTAGVLTIVQGILTIDETVEAWYSGLKSMLFAMIILLMAWALSGITDVLHTADYLVSILSEALPPGIVPALVFILSAATAFATGTSWGTMGILMPLVIPLAWATLAADGLHTQQEFYHIIYSTVSAVLAGAVWGDHCSPISDTTILSSMASGCDHIDHVRTQLPYALIVGFVAILIGTLPTGFGFPWWLSLFFGAVILYAGLAYLGKKVEERLEDQPGTMVNTTPGQ